MRNCGRVVSVQTGVGLAHSTEVETAIAPQLKLELLESTDYICNLELQKKFLLQEGYTNAKGKKRRPIYYIADFYYYDYIDNKWVVEDVKGVRTDVYKLKKKLFEYKYNLTITEL